MGHQKGCDFHTLHNLGNSESHLVEAGKQPRVTLYKPLLKQGHQSQLPRWFLSISKNGDMKY